MKEYTGINDFKNKKLYVGDKVQANTTGAIGRIEKDKDYIGDEQYFVRWHEYTREILNNFIGEHVKKHR